MITYSFTAFSQNTASDLFKTNNIVWYGLNFAGAKMVGNFDQAMGAGQSSAYELRDKWIPAWNGLMVNEPSNFKIKEAFRKNDVYYDLKPTEIMNHEINLDGFITLNSFTFSDADRTVSDIVSKLNGGEKKEGVGIVFIVESFNKITEDASVYVTVFDIKTKNVLITERVNGKPAGFGLRNFWAGAMKRIIKQVNDVNYKYWKSKNK